MGRFKAGSAAAGLFAPATGENKRHGANRNPMRAARAGLLFGALAAPGAFAATIAVNTQNMGIVFDSQCGLREAIRAVNTGLAYAGCPSPTGNGDRIVVPAGTYTTQERLDVLRRVTITGAGQNQTFIETGADYGFGIFVGNSAVPVIVGLEQLTLRKASQAQPQAKGILVQGGFFDIAGLKLDHVRITGFTGDGIRIDSPNAKVENTTPLTATLDARNCSIDHNALSGIRSEGATLLTLEFCRIAHNSASGLKLMDGPDATLTFCTVENNSTSAHGGGILSLVEKDQPQIRIYSGLKIANTTVSGNTAAGNGGGIYFGGDKFDAKHCTLSGNSAGGFGGGMYDLFRTDYSHHTYVTVAFNNAGSGGGGVYLTDVGTGTPEVKGSIVAKNTLAGNPGFSAAGTDFFTEFQIETFTSVFGTREGWNAQCDAFSTCGEARLVRPGPGGTIDPKLGPLGFHGGPTRVHPLLPGSPAINLGEAVLTSACDFSSCTAEDRRDQRGFSRPGNGNPVPGNRDWDAGAFELHCADGSPQGTGCENAAAATLPLSGQLLLTTYWGTGYCVDLKIENPNSVPATDWLANFNLNTDEIFDSWNLNSTGTTGAVTLTPTADWNRTIPAGGSSHSMGFCANLGDLHYGPGVALGLNGQTGFFDYYGIGVRGEFAQDYNGKAFQLAFVHSSRCLDAFGTAPGSNVGQWTCNGGNNQKWRFNDKGLGYFELVDVRDNLCLEVVNGSGADGADVRVNACNGSGAQQFDPVRAGFNTYQLKNKNSGKLVDVAGASTANGADVIQWPANGGNNQKLVFTPLP